MPLDQAPDDPVTQPFGRGIDRQHLAGGQRIGLALRLGEHDVFPRGELPPVVESDGTRHQEGLAHLDGPIEECLSGPDALQHAAVVAQHRVEDPQPAPGGDDAFRDDPPDAGHLQADLGPRERCDGRSIDISVREVPEEVLRGADADPLELLGAPLADPLEELDRHVQTHRGRGSSTWSRSGCRGHRRVEGLG